MITPHGRAQIANKVLSLLAQGSYVKDGQQVTVPIFRKEYSEESIQVYLYLTDEDVGTFTKFQILDAEGNIILDKPENITKTADKGMLIAFKVSIREEEI